MNTTPMPNLRPMRWPALAAALLLAGCASVSPDGLRGDVQATLQGRTAGADNAALPPTDPAAQRAAGEAVAGWLAAPLTQDAAVRIALLRHPGLQARLARLGVQDAERVQALTLPNPVLGLGRLATAHEREIERSITFSLVELVTLPWRNRWAGSLREQDTLAAAADAAHVASDARIAWLRAVAAQETLAAHERMHDAAGTGAELARRMASVGNWSRLQAAREQAVLADARARLARARLAAATEREALALALGLWGAPAEAITLPPRLPDLPTEPMDAAELEQRALRERLDVRAARIGLDRVAGQQGFARAGQLFGDIGLGYRRDTTTERGGGHSEVKRGWELELPLPLFDWGGAANARSRGLVQESAAQLQQTALRARAEVRVHWRSYRTAWELAQEQEKHVVPLQQQIQDETLLRYNGMLASVWDLLAQARQTTQAVADAVAARRDFWLADTDLQFALAVASPGAQPSASAAATSSTLSSPTSSSSAAPSGAGH
ncbi:copper resistance protein [Paracidovorax avenae]|uniref:TolC family protein n=2 Tax=Paracidovorax avenae TaxID=80867 RepID=UPI000D2027EA|nr:TolC family protein [Paracidovorax avenae]AVS91368.1 copper resistance protein [Paracidovorax avenae]AVS98762.1 copper resistance protein [Paracidovorax avenae]